MKAAEGVSRAVVGALDTADRGLVDVSVVIPAYNEARRIGATLPRVVEYLEERPHSWEILVVVDGSQDRTAEIAGEYGGDRDNVAVLDNIVNHGKGYSVRQGMLRARGRTILFSDADLSTPIEELDSLVGYLERGYDVAFASRALPGSTIRVAQPGHRQTMGRTFNRIVQAVALPGVQDSQCGFKCFRREAAQAIFTRQRILGFAFDVEILWIARRLGYRIAEVPVTWIDDRDTKIRPLRDPFWMLVDLARIRFNDACGRYR